MERTSARRIAKWDNAKALLIFLVVLGHIFDYYTKNEPAAQSVFLLIYTFHMPLFLFISGLFSKNTVRLRRWDHIFSYMLLYLLMKMIIGAAALAFRHRVSFSLLSTHWVPWYAFVMFIYLTLTILLEKLPQEYVFWVSIALACFAGYDHNIGSYLSLSKSIVFFPFFYLGYALDAREIAEELDHVWLKIAGAAGLILYGLFCALYGPHLYGFRNMLTSRYSYKALGDYEIYGGLMRLAYYGLAFSIGFLVLCIIPRRRIFLITELGQRTLQIYALHTVPLYFFMENAMLGELLRMITPTFYMFFFPLIAVLIVSITCQNLWGDLIKKFMYPLGVPHSPDRRKRYSAEHRGEQDHL